MSLRIIKKVLLVSHEMSYTGAPRSLLLMAQCLAEAGFEISVWTLNGGGYESEFRNRGFNVRKINFHRQKEEISKNLPDYDLVIANTLFCLPFAVFAQKNTATVLYLREAGNIPVSAKENYIDDSLLYEIRNIVCVSEYAASCIKSRYGIENIKIIHNFVQDESAAECLEQKKEHHENNKLRFAVIGTLEPRKGQLTAIKAYLSLPDKIRSKAELHFAGNAPVWSADYRSELNLKNTPGVFYHGVIKDRQDLLRFYSTIDVFLVPSSDESCSLVALEASMLGKAVLMSENVGASYLVDESCIFPAGNETFLAEKMIWAAENPGEIIRQGVANRERYLKFGTKEIYSKNIVSYINSIEDRGKAGMETDGEKVREGIKVSVVVPVCNSEDFLEECLDSLAAQSLEEIEFVCIDDGSTDSSPDILKKYSASDSRFRVITTKNHGYGCAMNLGIRNAVGEYIGILESDDYADPDMFKILYKRAEQVDADFVKGDFYRFYGDKAERELVYHLTARDKKNYNRVINPHEEKESFRFFMNTWSGIYKRAFLEQHEITHNETPGASYQDNGFWFKTLCYAERISFVNKPLYYNRRDNMGSSVKSRTKVYCANKEYALIRGFLRENPRIEEEYLPEFAMKMYHTYMFTLRRIAPEYKEEYIRTISDEFRQMKEKCELPKSAFTPSEWTELNRIMQAPEEFYKEFTEKETEISVVIAAYNSEKYIEECLKSLWKQTFEHFEVICVNDGSTDGTENIIKKYCARDMRFRLINQPNRGAGAARNRGLEEAKGKYVIFLDSDDYFSPDLLRLSREKIRQHEAEICIIGSRQFDNETGEMLPGLFSVRPEQYPAARPFQAQHVKNNPFRCFMGWAWDKLYLRSFLTANELKFQDMRTTNDMYFAYMSLFKAGRITAVNDGLIYQRRNVPGSLSKTREMSWGCYHEALLEMKRELIEMGIYEKNKNYFINYALHSSLWNLVTLDEETSKKLLAKLEESWFEDLGINEITDINAEVKSEYKSLQVLKNNGCAGLLRCRQEYRENEQKKKLEKKKKKKNVKAPLSGGNADYYAYSIEEIFNSKSYKIGRAVTWLPRKIRGW